MNRYVLFPFRGGALALVLTFTLGLELAAHAGITVEPLLAGIARYARSSSGCQF